MHYTLITRTGAVYQFYFLGIAECYQVIHGGVIIAHEHQPADVATTHSML